MSVAAVAAGLGVCGAAQAAYSTTDAFNGLTSTNGGIVSSSSPLGGFNHDAIFDGTNNLTIFADTPGTADLSTVDNFVVFQTPGVVHLAGFELNADKDPNDPDTAATSGGNRAMHTFTFSADTNNSGTVGDTVGGMADFSTTLIMYPNASDPSGTANQYVGGHADVTVNFPSAISASLFRLDINPRSQFGNSGVKLNELDAISVPEPASLGLIAMGGLGLLARRRGRGRN
jgi:hypothetical protein